MRQLLGNEPLQAILGAIIKKEEYDKHYDKHYVQMIDSIDPVSLLQPEGENDREGDTTGEDTTREPPLQQRANEILTAIRQRKQHWRQQRQQQRTTDDDNQDNSRRRTDTPWRQGEDTTGGVAEDRLAIVERPERRELQVMRRRRRRLVVATTTTVLACLSTVTTSLSQFNVHYIAVCCSATTGGFQLRQLETG